MALKNMRPAKKSGKDDDSYELHEPDGLEVHVSHEHMQKLGLKSPPPVGTKVTLHGEGQVTEAHSGEVDGEMRHHMRMTMHRASVDTEGSDERRKDVRGDVERAADQVEQKGKK